MAIAHAPFINASARVPHRWRDARGHVNTVIARASTLAAQLVESIVKEQIRLTGATATFTLLNNTAVQLIRSSNAWYTRRVGFKGRAAKYAAFADRGRPPGKMPFSAWLYEWLDAVGLARKLAYVVARGIGERGVEGHFFMRAARRIAAPRVRQILDGAASALARHLRGA